MLTLVLSSLFFATACPAVAASSLETHMPADLMTYAPEQHTQSEARDLLGPPAEETSFAMAMGLSEFRIELQNLLQQGQLQTGDTIAELTWNQGEDRLTIWFLARDGAYLHHLRWTAGDEF